MATLGPLQRQNVLHKSIVSPCCGSKITLDLGQKDPTGIFKRTVHGPVFNVDEFQSGKGDVLPLSRIGDLNITRIRGSRNTFLATWTAPGGDFTEDRVNSYRFIFSEYIADLLRPEGQPKILRAFDQHEYHPAGSLASIDFEFPHYDQDYYIAAYAMDKANNRGKISNIVHVRLPAPEALENEISDENYKLSLLDNNSDMDWIMIGVVAGVVGVLLLLSIVAISYYCVVTRKKTGKKAGSTTSMMNGACTDETDSSSFDSDIKTIMANPLGPTLSSLSGPQHQHLQNKPTTGGSSADSGVSSNSSGDTPINNQDGNSVTPVYWSASQLLSKLDQNGHHYPYMSSMKYSPAGVHHVPNGPHSLQQMSHQNGSGLMGPSSLHNVSFNDSLRYSGNSGGDYWTGPNNNQSTTIPEEYTITVGNLNEKVPPPVMPKPRNITQV